MRCVVPQELTALAALHDALWDAEVSMCRLAPGTIGIDSHEPIDLHPIRETALGAVLDLGRGLTERAEAAIAAVLTHQYDAPGRPWHGTFRVTAEDPAPRWPDAQQWRDYDPNWRQFLGCILGFIDLEYAEHLQPATRTAIARALERCVRGEPEDRIPEWYTNPHLLHAWLTGHVGVTTGDAALIAAGEQRRAMVMARIERYGDVDEYNSPTYDGIDLWAALLWILYPPTPAARADGLHLAHLLMARIEDLYHPDLAAVCGPHARVYGLRLSDHVALLGLVLRLLGVREAALPEQLTLATDHIHDLYFLPMLRTLIDRAPEVQIHPHPTTRHRVQHFDEVVATSHLGPGVCVGWENDRRVTFARDQYVAASVHRGTAGHTTEYLAVMLGRSEVRVHSDPLGDPMNPHGLRVQITAAGTPPDDLLDVRLLTSGDLHMVITPEGAAHLRGMDQITLTCAPAPTHLTSSRRGPAVRTDVQVAALEMVLQITWGAEEARGGVGAE